MALFLPKQVARNIKYRLSPKLKREILARAATKAAVSNTGARISDAKRIDLILRAIRPHLKRNKQTALSVAERQAIRFLFVRDPILFVQKSGKLANQFVGLLTSSELQSIGDTIGVNPRRFFQEVGPNAVVELISNMNHFQFTAFVSGLRETSKGLFEFDDLLSYYTINGDLRRRLREASYPEEEIWDFMRNA